MHKLFHFQLDFPDDHIAVNIGALLDAITLHRNQLPKSMIVEICINLKKLWPTSKCFPSLQPPLSRELYCLQLMDQDFLWTLDHFWNDNAISIDHRCEAVYTTLCIPGSRALYRCYGFSAPVKTLYNNVIL